MKKKHTRILWNENDQGEIFEFVIAEVREREPNFYRKYEKSFGNCNMIWEQYKAIDVLIYFFFDRFTTRKLAVDFLDQLANIDEFKEDMKSWIENMPTEENED